METIEEKIGYLVAKAEEQGRDLEAVSVKIQKLEDTVAKKLHTVEIVIGVVKFLGLALAAVLTFKFGDVSRLWDNLLG